MNHINKTVVTQWSKGLSTMLKDAKSCTRHGCKYRTTETDDCSADHGCIVHAYKEDSFITLMTLLEEEPDDR